MNEQSLIPHKSHVTKGCLRTALTLEIIALASSTVFISTSFILSLGAGEEMDSESEPIPNHTKRCVLVSSPALALTTSVPPPILVLPENGPAAGHALVLPFIFQLQVHQLLFG